MADKNDIITLPSSGTQTLPIFSLQHPYFMVCILKVTSWSKRASWGCLHKPGLQVEARGKDQEPFPRSPSQWPPLTSHGLLPPAREAGKCSFSFFFFKIFFSLFLPKAPQYIVVYSSLWVLLVVACETLPQHGLMSGAMSVPRIQTSETLGRRSTASELNHSATRPASA